MRVALHSGKIAVVQTAGPLAEALPPAVTAPGQSRVRPWRGRQLAVQILSLVACGLFWEGASRHGWTVLLVRFENIPAPSVVARAGWDFFHTPKALVHVV